MHFSNVLAKYANNGQAAKQETVQRNVWCILTVKFSAFVFLPSVGMHLYTALDIAQDRASMHHKVAIGEHGKVVGFRLEF